MHEPHWYKSSHSQGGNSNCVECRPSDGQVSIRDTQHRHLGHLTVPATEWRAFLQALVNNDLH
ncbi:DUF397 domain-containing protein [Spiractinospora alimapuensis]|uniref:DUF397 domain-containing protein n=1 Tax=Spiractinospora alimapuensis TaxID=2820884 RepID=UPI001F1766CA|nr:DUF397 domain-containing protein [Spiractinospora alimapuensis]QVQ52936.1 DUF397 domain-containing protein [Spiractinospora alimapuensis]